MKIRKKLLSILLTAALVLSLMPTVTLPALAASDESTCTFDITEGNITVSSGTSSGINVTYGTNQTVIENIDSTQELTIIGNSTSTSNCITVGTNITNPVNITLDGVTISSGYYAFSIGTGTTVYLTLSGSNSLSSTGYYAGLVVPNGATLYIDKDTSDTGDSLTATSVSLGSNGSAGIGGNTGSSSGTVIINGGTITANGSGSGSGYGGAGIGGGDKSSNGSVIINGGYVVANAGNFAAGIGGGFYGGGSVTINGGYVQATGGYNAAGIGNGWNGSGGSTPVISGGSVKASSFSISPVDDDANAVYLATVTGLSASTAVTYTVDDGSVVSTFTDSNGYLYLYLPANGSSTLIEIEDASGNAYSASGTVSSTETNTFAVIAISTPTLSKATVNTAYSMAVQSTAIGTTPYTWSASGLPDGISIDSDTGIISGTPTSSGTYDVTVNLEDSSTPKMTASANFTLVVEAAMAISTSALPSAYLGAAYNTTVSVARGTEPYSWSAAGLPTGLTINSSTGVISGIPKTSGTFSVTVTVKDSSVSQQSDSSEFSLVINPNTTYTYSLDSGSISITQNSEDSSKLDIDYNGTESQMICYYDMISIASTGSTSNTITVDASITNPVNITLDGIAISSGYCAFSIGTGTTVYLTLSGSNSLSSGAAYAGLQVPNGATLYIDKVSSDTTDSLTATSVNSYGTAQAGSAGIGGGSGSGSGTVIINGGTITANGCGNDSGYGGAGIGGGSLSSNGSVTINGGYVVANAGNFAAGIGGGCYGGGGSVTINGGYVQATGGSNAAGIGGGWNGSGGNTPVISGGSVKASSFSISPVDDDANAVYLVTITGLSASKVVTYTVDDGSEVSTFTDSNGYLYLYLPASGGSTLIEIEDASGNAYSASGTVSSTETNTFAVIAVLSSSISPTTASFDLYASGAGYKDISVALTLNDNTLSGIWNGTTALVSGTDYTVSDTTVTVSKSYLSTLSTGGTDLTFKFSAGSDQTLAVTVSDTTPSNSAISPTTASFDLYASGTGYKDISVTLTLNDNTLSGIWNGTTALVSGTDYTVSDTTVTVSKSYLSTLSTGGTTLTFKFSAGSDQTLAVTVSDTTPSSDATLDYITVNGSNYNYASGTYTCDVILPYGTQAGSAAATVYAAASDPLAQVAITQATALPGSATIEVTAEDGVTELTYTVAFTLDAALGVAPVIATTSLPSGTVGTAYSQTLTATGDTPITWTLDSGDLPDGLSLKASTGVISGTPSATGIFSFTVEATNGTGSDTQTLSITISATTNYAITASAGSHGGISPSGSVSVSSGGSQTFTITANSNYSISSVTVDSVSQGAISTYTFSNVSANHTISATFTYTGDSSGGGSSSGSTQSSYSATMSGDSSGKLTVTVDEDAGSASAALSDAQGKLISGGKSLVITLPEIDDVTNYIFGIPASGLSSDSRDGSLTMDTGAGSVTILSNMLTGTDASSGDTAQIELGLFDSSELSDEARATVGDRPVVSLTLYIDAAQTDWSNPDAPVTVSIPYTPAEVEDLNAIVVWYIDGDGNLNCVQNGHYDSETGTVTFQTTHFSLYAVGYNGVSFTDVSDSAWYADYVAYLAAREIVSGTGDGQFSPDASITRAAFVTILARMSGDDLSGYTTSSFTDVTSSDWYFSAVQWAYDSGVATGSDSKFNPNATITREQMAAMLYRYAEYAGDISNVEGMSAREFSDYDSISSWALAPIQWAMSNGIITGNPDCSFAPKANATRAQAAKMIAVLLQSVIVS